MKTSRPNLNVYIGSAAAIVLATAGTARSADAPTLKDAYKGHFYVGVAINRSVPSPPIRWGPVVFVPPP